MQHRKGTSPRINVYDRNVRIAASRIRRLRDGVPIEQIIAAAFDGKNLPDPISHFIDDVLDYALKEERATARMFAATLARTEELIGLIEREIVARGAGNPEAAA